MLVGIEGSSFKVFHVIGSVLSGELSRTQTGFVEFANRVDLNIYSQSSHTCYSIWKHFSKEFEEELIS